ncbi:phage tail tape measure C-terminal domain-containing protein [Pseudomonas putida]|uniref:phage tail tape measure C-terminal domain-containing protein n=1 Tax=Pseudomonas putida TaxID=303 RepID=UPI001E2C04DC|nr:phage tail tape measure C-terminal domain-containing protein [Pseudomonas putida]MCE0881050.1 tail tape measure protein [Pseudomonas putida]
MASRSLGTLTLDVIAQVGGFVAGMDKAERSSEKWRKQVEKNAKAVGTAVGAGLATAVTAITAMTMAAINSGSEISNLASVANVSTSDFQKLAAGAKTVGVEQDKLADILKDVNDKVGDFLNTGGGGMKDFFDQIAPKVGVTADQFRNLSGSQALGLYVSSLEKAKVSQSDMTFYLEAIASDATALLPLLRNNSEGFKRFGEAAEAAGSIMDEKTIRAAQELKAANWLVEQSISGLGNQITNAMLPTLANFATRLSDTTINGVLAKQVSDDLASSLRALGKFAVGTVAGIHLLGVGLKTLSDLDNAMVGGEQANWWDRYLPPVRIYNAFKNVDAMGKTLSGATAKMDGLATGYGSLIASLDEKPGQGSTNQIKELADLLAKLREGQAGSFTALKTGQQAAAKAAETAAKKLQSQFDTAEEGYKRQIALINTSTDKRKNATEVDKLAFELEQGKLQGLSEAQGKKLEGLAAELDAKKALLKADQDAKKLAALQVNLDEDNQTAKEGLDMELAGAGQGDKSRERFRALLAIEQDYNKQRREMYKEYKEALLAEDPDAEVNYQNETDALDKALKLRLEHQRNFYEQQDEMQGDWLAGVSDAWQNYVDIAADFSEQAGAATESILSDATSSISGSLQGIIKGTESVGDAFGNLAATMANSVLGALTDIAAKWIVVQALKMAGITAETTATVASEATKTTAKLATDAASTASSLTATATVASAQVAAAGTTMTAWLPAALVASVGSFGAAAIVGGTALLAAFALIKGFSGGGYTGAGGVNEPAGVVHKGEVVWSQADIKRFGGVSAVEALRKGKATPKGDLRSAGDSWELPAQVASSSDAAGSNTNVHQVFHVNGDVSPQTVAMIQQGMRQTMSAILQDVGRNGQIMQSIRKKL